MAAQRFRLKYLFWLDVTKTDEYELADTIEELKRRRTFAKTIRDGIRLVCDLRSGRLDVLLELFPWVKTELAQPSPVVPLTAIEEQLLRLEALMREGGAIPIDRPLADRYTLPPRPATAALPDAAPVVSTNDASQTFLDDFLNM